MAAIARIIMPAGNKSLGVLAGNQNRLKIRIGGLVLLYYHCPGSGISNGILPIGVAIVCP
jgi:hypothetical protein